MLRASSLLLLFTTLTYAGPVVVATNNATTLVNTLLGSGVTLSGTPTLTATGPQAGTFSGTAAQTNLIGFSSGILLSSGNAADAAGNYVAADSPDTSEGGPGSALLSGLIGGTTTNDAAELTFSFIPNASTLFFQYTFASAEYPNFVGSQYNDVFGFFVNGNDCAVLPGTTTPISINNVNADTNSGFFNKYNAAGDTLPYGGETTVLTCAAPVNAGVVNTITLGIADTSDSALDSAVFIQAGSVSTTPAAPEPATWGMITISLIAFGLIVSRRRAAVQR